MKCPCEARNDFYVCCGATRCLLHNFIAHLVANGDFLKRTKREPMKKIATIEEKRKRHNLACKMWRERNREKCRAHCQKWRNEHPERSREIRRVGMQKYRSLNPEKFRIQQKEWRIRNPEKARAIGKRKREKNAEGIAIRNKDWRKRNPQKVKQYHSKCAKNASSHLSESYIRQLLSAHNKVPRTFWPKELVELKRAEIKLKRLFQNQKTSKN